MSGGRVIHVSEMDRFPSAVYIGRAVPRRGLAASIWANPFRVSAAIPRDKAVRMFRSYLMASPALLGRLPELRGCDLSCWCRRLGEERTARTTCHGDEILAILDEYTDEELIAMAEGAGR